MNLKDLKNDLFFFIIYYFFKSIAMNMQYAVRMDAVLME